MKGEAVATPASTQVKLNSCTVDIATTPSMVELSVNGELDMDDADRIGQILVDAVAGGRPIVRVRLTGLTFADSSAVKAILIGARAAGEHGVAYELVNPHEFVQRLLDVTGLTKALTVVHEAEYVEGPNSL